MTVPVLGFGTAPILGRIGKAQSLAALDCAYRLGIRHFDTARSYGWGEAESVLGAFLAAHPRESYTLVSKGGFVPARRSAALALAKSVARQALRVLPASGRLIRKVASAERFRPASTYRVDILQQSLDASLRELGTSYLDVFLLHNFTPQMQGLHEVVDWMKSVRDSGRIKRFGFSLEGDLCQGLDHLSRENLLADCVVQAPVSRQLLSLPPAWRSIPFIAHSPFRFLSAQDDASRSAGELHRLLAALGAACNCEAVVCSMFTRAHVEDNVSARALAETTPGEHAFELS